MLPEPLKNISHTKVETRIYKVTPAMAAELLKLNIKNNRTPTRSEYYAGVMARNGWVITGETINQLYKQFIEG
jgi:hypothetical protein